MIEYILKRLVQVPITLIVITAIVFILLHLAGNLVNLLLPLDATAAQRAELTHSLHFDEPLPLQYVRFVGALAHGDFGTSLYYQRPAMAVVLDRLPASLELALAGILIAIVSGIALGILAAVREGSVSDNLISAVTVFGQSMPSFWLGIMLILLLAVTWHLLPTGGMGQPSQLIMPSITLAAFLAPQILLLTRSSMLDVLHDPYITVARSKGLPTRIVILRHALRNALNPVIASVGLQFGSLMGGAVITETVFAWPGLGQLSVAAIFSRDLPVVEASVVVLALAVLLANLAVDIINAQIDPRVRYR
ncbi:MAG: ABC transporter permease [Candidatus Dormibacteraeota bacterium]|uniref:ABC transporter permease n=1 Tax=Candidatus Dormiibacter inghamiae TaxID=3127013 RepID=A0A934K513_9BACT|nr:ABC transporter permease [Candidatus Dormibacteraeota bacterium]MBJ7605272.1 ABC transporter permease [Candidatus Dormibacteraeota bacterium]